MVQAWIEIHKEELAVDWQLAVNGDEPFRIAPLQSGNTMLCNVISVSTTPDFQIDLQYENGERRRFDMRPLLQVKPWDRIAAPALFLRASVEYGTVVWPGDIDIAPETLYEDSVPIVTAVRN